MSGTGLKRCCLAGLALAILFSGGQISAGQEASESDGFLLGALFRTRDLIDRTAADLQKVNQAIQENDKVIEKAENIITVAKQRNNQQAESVARDALEKSQEARKKNLDTRARLELTRSRAAASYAAIKNRFAAGLGKGPNSRIRGIVSNYSGRVQISKKSGERFNLADEAPGFLEPGDVIMTYGSSGAEVQTLDGRGAVQLGEYSELKLQEDSPEKQVVDLVRGKLYSAVDKADDFAKELQDKMKEYGDDLLALPGLGEAKYEALIQGVRKWKKKFEVRTRDSVVAVRGTKFSVDLKDEGTTEITVLEGAVEAGDLKGERKVLVEEGFRVIVTKDGISEPQKTADIDRWWDKQAGEVY